MLADHKFCAIFYFVTWTIDESETNVRLVIEGVCDCLYQHLRGLVALKNVNDRYKSNCLTISLPLNMLTRCYIWMLT